MQRGGRAALSALPRYPIIASPLRSSCNAVIPPRHLCTRSPGRRGLSSSPTLVPPGEGGGIEAHNLLNECTTYSGQEVPSLSRQARAQADGEKDRQALSDSDRALLASIGACQANRDVGRLKGLIEKHAYRDSGRIYKGAICSAIIGAFLWASRPADALKFFNEALAKGFHPTISVLESLIHGLLRNSDAEKAQQITDAIGTSLPHVSLRTATLNIWMGHYLQERQPEKARSIFRRLKSLALVPNQTTFLQFITYFVQKADYEAASKLQRYVSEAANDIGVDVRYYNGLLRVYSKVGSDADFFSLIDEMERRRVAYNEETFHILIKRHARVQDYSKVQELLDQMSAPPLSITPNIRTYNMILESYEHVKNLEGMASLLMKMNTLNLAFNGHTYAVITYNFLAQGKSREAIQMLFEIERKGIVLTTVSYFKLLRICCDRHVDVAVKILWNQVRDCNVPPNNHIFAILIKYHLIRRQYGNVDAIILEMRRKWNVIPNAFVFAALIQHYVECLDFVRLGATLEIIRECNVHVNSFMYDMLMRVFYGYSRLQQGGYVERFLGLSREDFARIKKLPTREAIFAAVDKAFLGATGSASLSPTTTKEQFETIFGIPFRATVHSLNCMMLSYFRKHRYEEMFRCVEELKRMDVIPNQTSYTFMIKARIFMEDLEGARTILMGMPRNGVRPTSLHGALLFHAYCRNMRTDEALSLLEEMTTVLHVRPNHVFYGSLIYAYAKRREFSRVFEAFEMMERESYHPDTETCNYVLISLFGVGEYGQGHDFFQRMCAMGVPRNTYTYAFMADSYAARKDLPGLIAMLPDCMRSGNKIDSYVFHRLLAHYYEEGLAGEMITGVNLMVEYAIRFDRDTVPYLNQVFHQHIENIDALPELVSILKKMYVDLDVDPAGQTYTNLARLRVALLKFGMVKELAELDEFISSDLPIQKNYWTATSPALASAMSDYERRQMSQHGKLSIPPPIRGHPKLESRSGDAHHDPGSHEELFLQHQERILESLTSSSIIETEGPFLRPDYAEEDEAPMAG